MKRRPVILITSADSGTFFPVLLLSLAVLLAGGWPKIAYPKSLRKKQNSVQFDALILSGGADVFVQERNANLQQFQKIEASTLKKIVIILEAFIRRIFARSGLQRKTDSSRDEMESELFHQAEKTKKPVLGICRGCQLINFLKGGSLHRDLTSFYTESTKIRSILPKKNIQINKNSRLGKILNTETCDVNALHDQAINELAEGFLMTAQEENGITQALESSSESEQIIGIQWHPEFLLAWKRQRRIFSWLIAEAQK